MRIVLGGQCSLDPPLASTGATIDVNGGFNFLHASGVLACGIQSPTPAVQGFRFSQRIIGTIGRGGFPKRQLSLIRPRVSSSAYRFGTGGEPREATPILPSRHDFAAAGQML